MFTMMRAAPIKFKEAFEEAKKTHQLELYNKQIGDSELINFILPFLEANPEIKVLNVICNNINIAGALALAKNNTLTELYLGNNNISEVGLQPLLANKTLQILCVNSNRITSHGVKYLHHNTTLKILDISNNLLEDLGALNISRNKTLETLNVTFNYEIGFFGRSKLMNMNKDRKEDYQKTKTAFLSCMTAVTKEDKELKSKSILFYYRNKNGNRLCDDLVNEVFQFVKPVKLDLGLDLKS
jgi:Leucine-rich repeat (LRR) protein